MSSIDTLHFEMPSAKAYLGVYRQRNRVQQDAIKYVIKGLEAERRHAHSDGSKATLALAAPTGLSKWDGRRPIWHVLIVYEA